MAAALARASISTASPSSSWRKRSALGKNSSEVSVQQPIVDSSILGWLKSSNNSSISDSRSSSSRDWSDLVEIFSQDQDQQPEALERWKRRRLTAATVSSVLRALPDVNRALRFFEWAGDGDRFRHTPATYNALLERLLDSGASRDAVRLFLELLDAGCPAAMASSFAIVIRGLHSLNKIALAARLLDAIRARGVTPDAAECNAVLGELCEARRMKAAMALFDRMADSNAVNHSTYHSMIHPLCKAKRADDALALLLDMKSRGFNPGTALHNVVIAALCRARRLRLALGLFRQMSDAHPPDATTFTKLVHGLAKTGELADAITMLQAMVARGFVPESATITVVVQALCAGERVDAARELVEEMAARRLLAPGNAIAYSALVDALCKRERIEEAEALMETMATRGAPPTVVTYNSVITGYCRAGHVGAAHAVMERMLAAGCRPDIITYTALIGGFCRMVPRGKTTETRGTRVKLRSIDSETGSIDGVTRGMALLEEVTRRGLVPDVVTYTTMIDGLCKAGRMAEAEALLARMSVAPTAVTYNSLVAGYCKAGDLDGATALLERMIASEGCAPDVVTFTTLMSALGRMGRADAARELFRRMVAAGLRPDAVSFASLVDGLCCEARVDDARELVEEMLRRGCPPSVFTYNALLDGYCKAGRIGDAETLLSEFAPRGFAPNAATFNLLIAAYCRARRTDRALECLDRLNSQDGVATTVNMYAVILDALCRDGRARDAAQLYEEMVERGHVPAAVSFVTLVSALCQERRPEIAHEILEEMIKHGHMPGAGTCDAVVSAYCRSGMIHKADVLAEQLKVYTGKSSS